MTAPTGTPDVRHDTAAATLGPKSRRPSWATVAAGLTLGLLVVLAIFGSALAPHDPNLQNLATRLTPPAWSEGGTWVHPLGTDQLGRDLLSLLLAGAQTSLLIAVGAALIEAIVGLTVGIVAGYTGGWTERVLMQWTEIQMGFPVLLIFMVIVLTIGASIPVITLALALNGWMIFARISRTMVKSLRAQGFVEAAIGVGARPRTVMFRHLLPHLRGQIAALLLIEMARLILAESGASFLGLGVQPPNWSWGLVLGNSRSYVPVAYHLAIFPGMAIVAGVLCLNVLSRWTRARFAGDLEQ